MSLADAREEREAAPAGTAEWVGRHQAYVWRYLCFLGCDAALAEDLLQDTLIAALQADVPAMAPGVARAWLRATARNLFGQQLRRFERQRRAERMLALDAVFEVHGQADLGEGYLRALEQCLQTLGGRERELLRLRYDEECSRAAMARALGVSAEGVKTLLRRVKEQLRRCIDRRRQL